MSKIFDSGDISLDDGGAVIAQNTWSDLESLTIDDYGMEIVKVTLEGAVAASVTGSLCIFSETYASWANAGAFTQAPMNTTGHIKTITVTAVGTINDGSIYFVNNDTSVIKKLYIAYYNTHATGGTFKARILYKSLDLG